jgi:DNA polymerase-3 subunit delta
MKIYANTLDSWLSKPVNTVKFFLLYGPEEGQAHYLSQKIINSYTRAQEYVVKRLEYKDVASNIYILSDELNSLSLLQEKVVIVIDNCSASMNKELSEFVKEYKGNNIALFIAGDLKPSSALRKSFETFASTLSIGCYKEEPYVIEKFIKDYLAQRRITFEPDIPKILVDALPLNRTLITNELEKLILYIYPDTQLNRADVELLITEASEISFDKLTYGIVTKNQKLIQTSINKIIQDQIPFIVITRILVKFFSRILEALVKVQDQGLSREAAVTALTPPVFFKQKEIMIKATQSLKLEKVKEIINKINQLELECKQGNFNPTLLTCK